MWFSHDFHWLTLGRLRLGDISGFCPGGLKAMTIPSVTTVISQVGQHWLNFDSVPQDRLEFAKERGSDFHRLAALHAKKLWIDDITDSCVGFFKSFQEWFEAVVAEAVLVEKTLVHPVLPYKGTPDIILRIKGDQLLTLMDYKTPRVHSLGWCLQLAAYRELAIANGYPVRRVASIQPHPDGGSAKFAEYTKNLTHDFLVFRSMLTIWRFFNS